MVTLYRPIYINIGALGHPALFRAAETLGPTHQQKSEFSALDIKYLTKKFLREEEKQFRNKHIISPIL